MGFGKWWFTGNKDSAKQAHVNFENGYITCQGWSAKTADIHIQSFERTKSILCYKTKDHLVKFDIKSRKQWFEILLHFYH